MLSRLLCFIFRRPYYPAVSEQPLSADGIERKRQLDERHKRQKELDTIVHSAIRRVIHSFSRNRVRFSQPNFHGASAIHPKWLAVWYIFVTDADLKLARDSGLTDQLIEQTKVELEKEGYPVEHLRPDYISFTSDEDIERVAQGNRYHYFK